MTSILEIGTQFKKILHLDMQPLYILGAKVLLNNCLPLTSLDRCFAKAMFLIAENPEAPPIYLDADQAEKGCSGGMQWSGFCEANPMIRYFVSIGHKDFRNGMAEFLRASPELVDKGAERIGKIKIPGKYLVICAAHKIAELELQDATILAITCFGSAEQIRNLAALVHFHNLEIFQNVIMAVGPACSTFVSYPAGLAENAPKNAAYIGPADPTGNIWFPPNFMALGLPINLAQHMSDDIEASFLTKRPQVAFPTKRIKLKYPPQ